MLKTINIMLCIMLIPLAYPQCDDKCLDCQQLTNICQACKQQYQTDINGVCHQNTIDKCNIYGPTGECFSCQVSYSFQGNACVKSFTGCVSESFNNQCSECGFGRALVNGNCSGVINCAVYSQNCQKCAQGYRLSNNICVDVSTGCAKVRSNDGLCESCKPGYFYSGYQCFESKYKNSRCYILSNNQNCLYCKLGYNLIDGKCYYSKQVNTIGSNSNGFDSGFATNSMDFNSFGSSSSTPTTTTATTTTLTTTTTAAATAVISPTSFSGSSTTAMSNSGSSMASNTGSSMKNTGSSATTTSNTSGSMTSGIGGSTNTQFGTFGSSGSQVNSVVLPNQLNNFAVANPISTNTSSDPHCRQFQQQRCLRCSIRYYVGSQGKCIPVNPLCKQHNANGECTSCYSGYIVQFGKCIISQSSDKNCKTFSGQICSECYAGYFYSQAESQCKRLNQLCKTSNLLTGACLTCYGGYSLMQSTGNCVISAQDSNCKQSRGDGLCLSCSKRFYLNSYGKCTAVNPLCKQYNQNTGACTTCYNGYRVNGNICVPGTSGDVNCKNLQGELCIACFPGYYLQNNRCLQISPLCKTFDGNSGSCTSCYPGYDLSGPSCVINDNKDKNCKVFDRNVCQQCYNGYFLINGVCKLQNPLCKTIDRFSGACLSCWPGYTLAQSDCIVDTQPGSSLSSDPYCIKFSFDTCIQCSGGYYLDQKTKICTQSDPLCKTYDFSTGYCLTCYPGYYLSDTKCLLAQAIAITNCNTVTDTGICLECLEGYYVSNNQCKPVPLECATYNRQTGQCLTCIDRHFLQDGVCIYPGIFDQNCIRYESAFCSRCRPGFYLQNYMCYQVNQFCYRFNFNTFVCELCVNGMMPQGAQCY